MFAWWFNIILLVVVVGSFGYFLYSSYGTAPSEENTKIPFEPRMWNNAVRNVPTTNYGQEPKIDNMDSILGFSKRSLGSNVN